MKILIIGGTGTISMAITRLLAEKKEDLYLINRGNRSADIPEGVKTITVDINDEDKVKELIGDMTFDCVCDFIGFGTAQVERDYRLFAGKTRQYIYISSASAYHKPVASYIINEGTALGNPYWSASINKIACEELLMKLYRENGFPVTIVRPSYTYDERRVPLGVTGRKGSFQVLKRMMEGKPVIIQGDGTSLWTMTCNEDFAKGFVGLIGNIHAIGEAFQITCDETLTWDQIYQILADILGVELKAYHVASDFLSDTGKYDLKGSLVGDKSNSVVFDNSKLKAAVPDFRPSISFAQGMRRTIANIMAHPELQVEDPEFDEWCDHVIAELEEAKRRLRNA